MLQALQAQARANGVHDCEMVTAKECERLEPAVRAAAGGLLSAGTGIIDSHALMEVLQGEAEEVCSAELTCFKDSSIMRCAHVHKLHTHQPLVSSSGKYGNPKATLQHAPVTGFAAVRSLDMHLLCLFMSIIWACRGMISVPAWMST
jgi:hypothetical protein